MTNDKLIPNDQIPPSARFSGFHHSLVLGHWSLGISRLYHVAANFAAAKLMKLLFSYSSRIYVVGRENVECAGGFLLASNHISHFDPFIISSVVRRKIDWMAMAEFFPMPIVGLFLRAVDAFAAERDRADRKTIRTAIERLQDGRVVGVFPEGGIRDGARSLLEGAPIRAGASTLAHIAGVPIIPCVILGSDRLYSKRNWLPFRRVPVWIAFGKPVSANCDSPKFAAREQTAEQLAAAFGRLCLELRERFALTADDLPHPPRERMKGRSDALRRPLRSSTVDFFMCSSMNALQARHHLPDRSREEMERYVSECEQMTPSDYYALPLNGDRAGVIDDHRARTISWPSPIKTKFAANDVARADLFPCSDGWQAPTVLMLHALMSATRIGYRRWAAHFNRLGWNACFVHLPYHYSRVPAGYWNGELAITADLIRNAEALRQGVIELRQLLKVLRDAGSNEFAVLGTSYGGWIGALLALVERDFRFMALMGPIVNVEHAIWENPATKSMRRQLRRAKVNPGLVARHYHLSSPLHAQPFCDPARLLFVSGEFDVIARPDDLDRIHQKWRGSQLLRVRQGHFGYRMFRETVEHLEKRGLWSL